MELTDEEKKFLKFLLKKELSTLEKQEKTIEDFEPEFQFLAAEEKYELLLKDMIKKLED
ncbi:hypothetical protein GF336_01260 [Candidatus Woesearchaeota archaeon]|nr:hypothetical protein [Candidatus Woesearchaeota archaeon]